MDDGPAKQAVIDKMVRIVQEDAPWSFGYFPYASGAYHHWVHNGVPSIMVRDLARYMRIDTAERVRSLREWNQPVYWPLLLLIVVGAAMAWGARRIVKAREQAAALGGFRGGDLSSNGGR
jgi:hypothetical protein